MATRKALVQVGGQIQEMPSGDTLEGAGGGGGSNLFTATVTLNFGTAESEIATTTVANTVITNANFKGLQILWQTSTDHDSYEDYKIEDLELSIENIIDNTSFEVVAFAPNNTWGNYNFKIFISY